MPAYSFQERFVPFVKDGSKPHTIRKRRSKGFAKKGDTLYLYYGMRTKYCKKLREETCIDVRTIVIDTDGEIFLFKRRLTDEEIDFFFGPVSSLPKAQDLIASVGILIRQEKENLAWRDGFRPEGTTLEKPEGSFSLMYRYWKQTNELPFIGDIIYWDPK